MDIPVDYQTFFDETEIEIAGRNERTIQWIYARQLRWNTGEIKLDSDVW